jgi:hypothetical protein
MAITTKRGNKFSLKKLEGLEEAKVEMERRLNNLVILDKIKLSKKGDQLRGVKIDNQDNNNRLTYLLDGTTPINIKLSDTNGNTTDDIQIEIDRNNKRKIKTEEITLDNQKLTCTIKLKDNIPFLEIETIKEEVTE